MRVLEKRQNICIQGTGCNRRPEKKKLQCEELHELCPEPNIFNVIKWKSMR
jgi:hypothetical protein